MVGGWVDKDMKGDVRGLLERTLSAFASREEDQEKVPSVQSATRLPLHQLIGQRNKANPLRILTGN